MMVASAAKAGAEKTSDVVDFFRESGFGGPSAKEKESGAKKPKGTIGTIISKLSGIFLESKDQSSSNLMLEQSGLDLSDVQNAFDEIGLSDDMNTGAKEYIELTEDTLKEIYEIFGEALVTIREMKKSRGS